MKSSISIPAVLCFLRIFLLVPSCHCADVSLTDENNNLIQQTCHKKTPAPYYDLCVSSLTSAPGSSTAKDVKGLALVMFTDVLLPKFAETQNKINEALQLNPGSSPLWSCKGKYERIAQYLTEISTALSKKDYISAVKQDFLISPLSDECASGDIPPNVGDMSKQVSSKANLSGYLLL